MVVPLSKWFRIGSLCSITVLPHLISSNAQENCDNILPALDHGWQDLFPYCASSVSMPHLGEQNHRPRRQDLPLENISKVNHSSQVVSGKEASASFKTIFIPGRLCNHEGGLMMYVAQLESS